MRLPNPFGRRRATPDGAGEPPARRRDAIVTEGRLVEAPSPDAKHMDRRAFGEFESPRGELASYAFGWGTELDPQRGRLTLGFGAGNPGGATVHAVVFISDEDGRLSYGLVDEPFEEVPEGGPHVTADHARTLDELPFLWAMTDTVMERDRRAWWMRHWLEGTPALQTAAVFEGTEPVLTVDNFADEAAWGLIGETAPDPETNVTAHLFHALDDDPTLLDVLDLEPGEYAWRKRPGGAWTRERQGRS